MKIVTSEQMRLLEERSEAAGVSTDALMENAGLAVAESLRRHLGSVPGRRIVLLVGKGNNGGDGLVTARHLRSWGGLVQVWLVGSRPKGEPRLAEARAQGLPINEADDGGLHRLRESLDEADAVVDAVLGTGASRPLEGTLGRALAEAAAAKARRPAMVVLALDLPTGLDADTGAVDPACLAADITVTLGRPKAGLYRFPGAEYTGRVDIAEIALPDGLDAEVPLELITREWARSHLPKRPLASHKGTFGRTMIVAGSRHYVGAAILAANAAGRVGAGLVTLAVPESLQAAVAAGAVEATHLPLPEASPGEPSPQAAADVLGSLSGYSSLLLGSGIGRSAGAESLVQGILLSGASLPPVVVDADGLNLLPQLKGPEWWRHVDAPAVLTPHPGEMARLAGVTTKEVGEDRVAMATGSAAKWNKVVALKGAFTVVALPDGRAMLSPFSNPGLASAGTGDVLAGAVAGLLSQGPSLEVAAALGVYLHGQAGEIVRDELGEAGMLAGDLLGALPTAIEHVKG